MSIRLIVVDDHPAIVDGVSHLLRSARDIVLAGSAGTIARAQVLFDQVNADVALIDLRLADGSGIDLVAQAAARGRPATLVYSTYAYDHYVAAALRAGAHGFLLKTAPRDELETAIRRVASGGTVFTAEQLRAAQQPYVLTDRERRIVALVMKSRSNDEIARDLGLSRKTVEAALTRLFERYQVLSRTELGIRASMEGWLDV